MRDVVATLINLIYQASKANSDLPQDWKDTYIYKLPTALQLVNDLPTKLKYSRRQL